MESEYRVGTVVFFDSFIGVITEVLKDDEHQPLYVITDSDIKFTVGADFIRKHLSYEPASIPEELLKPKKSKEEKFKINLDIDDFLMRINYDRLQLNPFWKELVESKELDVKKEKLEEKGMFKIGDNVKTTEDIQFGSIFVGDYKFIQRGAKGTIKKQGEFNKKRYLVTIFGADYWYYEEDLEMVSSNENIPKFKKGDKVIYKEKEFEIKGVFVESSGICYILANDTTVIAGVDEKKIDELKEEENVPKFKIGDEVKAKFEVYSLIYNSTFMTLVGKGSRGIVLKQHETCKKMYLVNFSGRGVWIEENHLELAGVSPKEETNSKVELHKKICKELNSLYKAKNADYGDSFSKVRQIVPNAILVRLNDKIQRLNKLMTSEEHNVKSESIRDSFIDLANYCILELIEMEGEK